MKNDNNRGAIFRNKYRKSDKHPYYHGSLVVNNIEYWVASWVQRTKDGKKQYLSFSLTEKGDVNEGMQDQERFKGVLFKNDRKERVDQPDYTGNITVKLDDYWFSGWILTAQNTGEKYMSLKVNPRIKALESNNGQTNDDSETDDYLF